MPDRLRKRPRDPNQLAKLVADIATGEVSDRDEGDKGKNPHAVALGKLGGKTGGAARAAKLSSSRRREIAKKAATVRWAARVKKADAD